MLRSLGSTHQYLSKPCDPETLKQTLVRACAVRMLLADDALKQVVSQLGSLPSLPTTYVVLLDECRAADASVIKVADAISQDMAMTAKVLQMANSAFFGRRRRVSDPLQAVQLLGLNTVKALVLSAYAFGEYEKRGRTPGFSLERLQAHSVMTGAFARVIAAAERAPEQMLDDASVAALLARHRQAHPRRHAARQVRPRPRARGGTRDPDPRRRDGDLRRNPRRGRRLLAGPVGPPRRGGRGRGVSPRPRRCVNQQWSALTLIHVANALASELEKPDVVPAHTGLDAEYDPEGNFEARLPVWRSLCRAEMMEYSQ